jgi:hypothetical protein
MTGRGWILIVIAVAVTSVFLLRSATSHAAGAGVGSGQDHDALTAARFEVSYFDAASIKSFDTEGIEVNVVNQRLANETVGDAFCRFAVTFYDERGFVLYTTELSVGPGEIGRVDLPVRQLQGELLFRTTIQVLDTYSSGKIRPCPAIPSARVYDRIVGKTEYYVPVTTN